MDEAARLRQLFKQHLAAHEADVLAFKAVGGCDLKRAPLGQEAAKGLACGAKTRAGGTCRHTLVYGNGRCKFHGGLSTGPTTQAGKAKAAANGKVPKKKRTP
jgi:hypothetical protein